MALEQQIICVTIQPSGQVDVQVRGSGLSIQSYGHVIGTAVRMAAAMFANTGEVDQKEATRAMLKEINKTAYGTENLRMQGGTIN